MSYWVISDSLRPHGLQDNKLSCPPTVPGACSSPCPPSRWCYTNISSSVISVSSYLQSFQASGSFPMSQFFSSSGQSIGVSTLASVLPMNIQDWLTGLIPLLFNRLSHPYMITGKIIALTIWTFVSKVMSLFFNTLFESVSTVLSVTCNLMTNRWHSKK